MAKVFKIDDFTITLEDSLFEEACRVYVLEDENNLVWSDTVEECRKGNHLTLSQKILASFRESLDDLNRITYEYIRSNFTDEEVSKQVSKLLVTNIKRNGGNYDIT